MKDNNHYDKGLYLAIFDVGLPNKIATRIDLCFKTTGLLGYINNDEFAKNKIEKINQLVDEFNEKASKIIR